MEIFKLLGTIAVDSSAAEEGISRAESSAEKAESKIGKAFDKIGSAAVACGKVIATGLAVGATAFATLATKALDMAGELEQNLGGAEAVFGEFAGKMEATAQTAFSSMGLSVSDFLATANKMGSLFKGAGFSVEESADLTAEAMQRAADVASIMGIDVSVAMESVAGAAKGNFTMMDNLGVAINDTNLQAYALAKGIEKSTSEMTSQEKIALAMQMFLEKTADYAGNYAKENETLAGSLTTAKAAMSNFMSGASDVSQVADALVNAGTVISEKLLGLLPSLVSGIGTLLDALIPEVPPLLQELLPAVVDGAVTLVNGLVASAGTLISALMEIVPDLIAAAGEIMSTIGSALLDNIDFILDSALQIVLMLAEGLLSALPKLADAACEIVEKLGDWIAENADTLVESGVKLIATLTKTLVTEIPKLIKKTAQAVKKALPALVKSFGSLETELNNVLLIVGGLVVAFKGFKIITTVVSLISKLKAAFVGLNAVMNANPIGLVVSSVGLAVAAFGAFSDGIASITESTHELSDEFLNLQDDIESTQDAIESMDREYAENAALIEEETKRTEDLWKELQNLTDETGYVTDANKDRAEYLLSELNEALGTEYEMNGNIIGQYQQMQTEIDELIKKRKAERLFEKYEEKYTDAQNNLVDRKQQLGEAQTAVNDYYAELDATQIAFAEYIERMHDADKLNLIGADLFAKDPETAISKLYNALTYSSAQLGSEATEEGWDLYNRMTAAYSPSAEKSYNDALAAAQENYLSAERTFKRYEDAEYALFTGDYEKAIDLLQDDTAGYWAALEEGAEVAGEEREALIQSLQEDEAAIEAYRKGLENGDPLLTQERFDQMLADFVKKLSLLDWEYDYISEATAGLVDSVHWGTGEDSTSEKNTFSKFYRLYEYDSANTTQRSADDVVITQTSLSDEDRADVQNISDKIDEVISTITATMQEGFAIRLYEREFGRLILRTAKDVWT